LVVERWERVVTEEKEEEGVSDNKGSSSSSSSRSRSSSKREGGREGWGEDRIVLRYNGLVVRTLEGGLAEWNEVYAEALAVR